MTAKMSEQIAHPSVRHKSVVVQENQILAGCGARPRLFPAAKPRLLSFVTTRIHGRVELQRPRNLAVLSVDPLFTTMVSMFA